MFRERTVEIPWTPWGHPSKVEEASRPSRRQDKLPRWPRLVRPAVLAACDLSVIAGCGYVAAWFWGVGVRRQPIAMYLDLWPLLGLFLLGFAMAGLYSGFGLGAVETLRRFSLSTSFVFLLVAAASFALKIPHQFSRMTFGLTWAACLLLLPAARFVLLGLLNRTRWWGEPTVILGDGALARETILTLDSARALGYRPSWVIAPNGGRGLADPIEGLPVVGGLERCEELGRRGVRVALIATDNGHEMEDLVIRLERHFRHVVAVRGKGRLPVEGVRVKNLGGIFGIEFGNQLLQRRNQVTKRCLDLVVGGLSLIATLPILVLSGILVKLSSRGPVLYHQVREGKGGRPIKVWKLRTMYADAERRLEDHLATDPEARMEWERRFKLPRDPRVVPGVGTFLRRFSIDELPQLFTVLKGEMSLVGPRPFPAYHLEALDGTFRKLRCRVRPGLTGLWQVMARSDGDVLVQERFDTYYIRNWSAWIDLYILSKTFATVISGRGAY